MKIRRIKRHEIDLIRSECGRFIRDSGGLPLVKDLPSYYENFKKVKVRKKRLAENSILNNIFGEALGVELYMMSLIARGAGNEVPTGPDLESFYIFPVDKYKFLYCTEVKNISVNYGELIDTLSEKMSLAEIEEVIGTLLKLTYTHDDLEEGIRSGAEIVFFGVPRYYAIKRSAVSSYDSLIGDMT